MSDRARYLFRVQQHVNGTPHIILEPVAGDLVIDGDGYLGLDLRADLTAAEAQRLAQMLNELVVSVSYTTVT